LEGDKLSEEERNQYEITAAGLSTRKIPTPSEDASTPHSSNEDSVSGQEAAVVRTGGEANEGESKGPHDDDDDDDGGNGDGEASHDGASGNEDGTPSDVYDSEATLSMSAKPSMASLMAMADEIVDSSVDDVLRTLIVYDNRGDGTISWIVHDNDRSTIARLESEGCKRLGTSAPAGGSLSAAVGVRDQSGIGSLYRAIVRGDGAVFYQHIASKTVTWNLPEGARVTQRAKAKSMKAAATVLKAVVKLKGKLRAKRAKMAEGPADEASASKAAAEAAPEPASAPIKAEPAVEQRRMRLQGWMYKTRDLNKGGPRFWKRRWMELDWHTLRLKYFGSNPSVTFEKLGVDEPTKGEIDVQNAEISLVDATGLPADCKDKRVVCIKSSSRLTWLTVDGAAKSGTLSMWNRTLQTAARAEAGEEVGVKFHKGEARDKTVMKLISDIAADPERSQEAVRTATCRVSNTGHVWSKATVMVLPWLRVVLVVSPTRRDDAASPTGGLTSSLTMEASLPMCVPISEATPIEVKAVASGARTITLAMSDAPSAKKVWISFEDNAQGVQLEQAIRLTCILPSLKNAQMISLLPSGSRKAVIQADAWKCDGHGKNWRLRRVQVSSHERFVRYMDVADAEAAKTAEERDKLAKGRIDLAGSDKARVSVCPGCVMDTDVLPAPYAVSFRCDSRVYVFACTEWSDYRDLVGSLATLVAGR
jgi:hypothetical protein